MTDGSKNIELSAKLLNADKSEQKNSFSKSRDNFFDVLGNKFRPILEESSVTAKEKIFDEILDSADDIEIFGSFPALIGKTFVGVVGFDKNLVKNLLESVADSETAKILALDTNLPTILVAGGKSITAVNDMGNHVALNFAEYAQTNSLWREKIEIQQILQFFFVTQNLKFQNIAVVYLPEYFNSETPFGKKILQKLDAGIVYTSAQSDKIKNRKLLEEISRLRNFSQIPFYVAADAQNIDTLRNDDFFKAFEILTENGSLPILEQLNILRRNYLFVDAVKSRLLTIRKFYEDKIKQLKADKTQIAGDLALITLDATKETVRELDSEIRRELNAAESEVEKLRGVSALLSDAAKNYESEIEKFLGVSENIRYRESTKEIWRTIFFQAIDIGDFKLATDYTRNLERSGDAYGYICRLIIQAASGNSADWSGLERLRREPDNEFVRRAKLRLTRELKFSEFDYMQIARDVHSIETPEENYFRGLWLEHSGEKQKSIRYFENALKQNYEPAGKKLFELAGNDERALQILSDKMVPEANFALAQTSLTNKKYAAANRYFKLAAIRGHIPAIKFLADDFSAKLFRNYKPNQNLSSTEKNQAVSCIEIYKMILEKSGDSSVKEKIGDIYHILDDDRRALEWWRQCQTADSFYKRGRLYEYADGAFSQDLDEAENLFNKAASMGHQKASAELAKVRNWKSEKIRKVQAKKVHYERREYSSSSSSSSSSGSFCVITSAACAALHKPDDCEELNALRAYRDKMKSENPVIAALIEEYYRVAPLLVRRMDLESEAEKIYAELWKQSIAETYRLIQAGENLRATSIYIEMVQELCRRYGVELSEGISEKIRSLKLY